MTTIEALSRKEAHVGVVGLGYVGRPLAAALHRHFSVYGFDTDARLIRALRGDAGADRAPHPDAGRLRGMGDRLTADPAVLGKCSFIVVTVPTPITADRVPDLTPLRAAARSIGRNLKPGCVVVVESTVYPGVTEEVVGPIIARASGLEAGSGFHLGYSPERINPGDDAHALERLVKVIRIGWIRTTDDSRLTLPAAGNARPSAVGGASRSYFGLGRRAPRRRRPPGRC